MIKNMINRFSILFFLLLCLFLGNTRRDATATPPNISRLVTDLEKDYGIKVIIDSTPRTPASWKIAGQIADPDDEQLLFEYLEVLNWEFRKHPKTFIRNMRLNSIVLVKKLSVKGQLRAAMPDYTQQMLWLDFKGYGYSPTYRRHVIHHELYHLIEFELFHGVYWKDPQWMALNPLSFRYGNGGASTYKNGGNQYEMIHPQPGFVNRYSMSGVEEDKAEVFACLFVDSERKSLMKWKETDTILAAKIIHIKNGLLRLDEAMNGKFWNNLERDAERPQPIIVNNLKPRNQPLAMP